jgi:hypothetical protein
MELLPNHGFLLHKFSTAELAPLREEVAAIQSNWHAKPFNLELVGNLQREFLITDSRESIEHLLTPLVEQLEADTGYAREVYINQHPGKFVLDDVWVNYQRAGEFNPVHDHRGVYSWVIWLDLPYTLKEEDAHVPWANPHKNFAGQFVIHYTDIVGNIKNYPLPTDQRMTSHCAIFPSRLRHSVYPFYTTDKYRISVSGNFLAE